MQVMLVVALLFAVVVAVFAVQNAAPIAVQLLAWQVRTSVAVVVLSAAASGALAAGLLGAWRTVQLHLRVRSLKAQLERAAKGEQKGDSRADAPAPSLFEPEVPPPKEASTEPRDGDGL